MIEAISQYSVELKGPTLQEVRVTNNKKELELTKEMTKDHAMEWKKHVCSNMYTYIYKFDTLTSEGKS